MGSLQAQEMLTHGNFDTALEWHLTCNHYPPVHKVFIPVAKEAIALANSGDYDAIIEMPNGRALSVADIVRQLHLDTFLETNEKGE